MSDFVLHRGQRTPDTFARTYGSDVLKIVFEPGSPAIVELADGRSGQGSCLGCGTPLCIEKTASELILAGPLDTFPGEPSLDVCPTRAAAWVSGAKILSINADDCIGCGLCVVRCPYGAISLSEQKIAVVNQTDPDKLLTHEPACGPHCSPARSGAIARLGSAVSTEIPQKVSALIDSRAMLLIRNLLNEIGMNARHRRRGDTNVRIDAVGISRSGRPFVAEIELTSSVIESPRALLEDIAVLHSRYGYAVSDVDALSIILSFPNLRSEYYQVIRDIDLVLGVRCRTITVGALIALLWNFSSIDGVSGDDFFTGEANIDLSTQLPIEANLLDEPYPGAFRPMK